MEISQKVLEKAAAAQKKERDERSARLEGVSKKLYTVFEEEGTTVKDASIVLRGMLQALESSLQAKMKPAVEEFNNQTMKAFYGQTEEKPAGA